MRAILVTDPAEVDCDPDNLPWLRRLKYTTTAEYLGDIASGNIRFGVADCPVEAYLRDHLGDDVIDVTEYIFAHEDWGPAVCCLSLWRTLFFNNKTTHRHGDHIAAWAQHYNALELVKHHPFERARTPLSAMLKHHYMRFVSPEAAYVILAYLNAGHPNPRRFLEKPEVAAKFTGLDISRFAAPDFD